MLDLDDDRDVVELPDERYSRRAVIPQMTPPANSLFSIQNLHPLSRQWRKSKVST